MNPMIHYLAFAWANDIKKSILKGAKIMVYGGGGLGFWGTVGAMIVAIIRLAVLG